jgi:hypothetical protein
MKIRVIKFRYQRVGIKIKQRVWVKEHKAYHYDIKPEVIEFLQSWIEQNDNSQLQRNS